MWWTRHIGIRKFHTKIQGEVPAATAAGFVDSSNGRGQDIPTAKKEATAGLKASSRAGDGWPSTTPAGRLRSLEVPRSLLLYLYVVWECFRPLAGPFSSLYSVLLAIPVSLGFMGACRKGGGGGSWLFAVVASTEVVVCHSVRLAAVKGVLRKTLKTDYSIPLVHHY